jgi:hypothetical protein
VVPIRGTSDRMLGLRLVIQTGASAHPEAGSSESLTALFLWGLYKYIVAGSKLSLLAL